MPASVALTYTITQEERTMATDKQLLGVRGEKFVAKNFACPRCKSDRTLRALPPNFKCADIICDFCGYLAQVKTTSVLDVGKLPKSILGAAWKPQYDRMRAGIFFPLFVVLSAPRGKIGVYYLSADLQGWSMFRKRKPLSAKARRAGWQGFNYDLSAVSSAIVRLV